MSTFVWPRMFELEFAPSLNERSVSGQPSKRLQELLRKFKLNEESQPIALRWRVHPDLGFPREPFKVFRRHWDSIPPPSALSPLNAVYANQVVGWGNIPLIDFFVHVVPTAGNPCTLQALDEHQEAIFGETVTVSGGGGTVRMHHPNICSFRITGSATLSNFKGLSMQDYARDTKWDLIEEVGLPYKLNEVVMPTYDARLQGKPTDLKPGHLAAHDRLLIGLAFSESPNPLTAASDPTPPWNPPTPADVMAEIRAPGVALKLITDMLDSVDPNLFVGNQADYSVDIPNDGISQEGGAASSEPSEFGVPVGSMFLLGAATDIHPSLALGFGTTDFPDPVFKQLKFLMPARAFQLQYDYMVMVPYLLPFGMKVDVAALGSPSIAEPPAPGGMSASTYQRNRGIDLDDQEREDVRVEWNRQPRYISPHGFYVGIIEGANPPVFLNAKRDSGAGFIPILPASRPDGDLESEANVTYIDTNRIVPFTGSRTDRYEVAVQDVFGRFSDWATVDHSLSPKGPDIPALLEVKILLDMATVAGRSVGASLQIDLVWDWEDRGPKQIQLRGKFFTGDDPGPAPAGMQKSSGGPAGVTATLTFSQPLGGGQNELPVLAGSPGTVAILPPESGDGEAVRYRVTLEGFTMDFSAVSRLYYAVYARAAEKVNPAVFSGSSAGLSTVIVDPLPADPPVVSPDLRWTALPDANGYARYKVAFPAQPYASGYLIYEATEAAMRNAAALGAPADELLTTRVLDLQGLPFAGDIIDTFSRMTRDPLPSPEIEVSLPGSVDGIYAYNFSTVTAENIESTRSNTIYIAVPRRFTPGAPSLQVRQGETEGSVNIQLEAGAGSPPASMELYRTRSSLLSLAVNKMGPPIIERTDPSWVKTAQNGDAVASGNDAAVFFKVEDSVNPSWFPYYYRGIAWGVNDPVNGIYPGRSASSPVVHVLIPPADPPDLEPITVDESTDGSLWKISFRSKAEWRLPPAGPHKLSVQTVDRTGTTPSYTEHLSIDLPKVEELTGAPTEVAGQVYRHSRDGDGRWQYDVWFAKGDTHVTVILTDPLQRRSVVKAELVPPVPVAVPPDLVDVSFNRFLFWLTIHFKSACSIAPPFDPGGGFVVETFDSDSEPWHLFNMARLHQIGTSGGLGQFKRSATPDGDGRYSYQITRCVWFRTVHEVAVRITSSDGLVTELTS
ncbi:MAG: hypothetical protein H6581_28165 [Bacteroidia bacterium]|nr:hypothetical protein [Bacteroidia bacterium]